MLINLRQSTPEDARELAACVDSVARERRWLGNVFGFKIDETRRFIQSLIDGGGIQLLALADESNVGWCDVTRQPFEGVRHVGRLGMGLLPKYRRQGMGKRLLQNVLKLSFEDGVLRVELEVFASNQAAIGLYEASGFVHEGRKRRTRILDGTEDDIIVMGLLRDEWRGNINSST